MYIYLWPTYVPNSTSPIALLVITIKPNAMKYFYMAAIMYSMFQKILPYQKLHYFLMTSYHVTFQNLK
jgi:hypothetical protein